MLTVSERKRVVCEVKGSKIAETMLQSKTFAIALERALDYSPDSIVRVDLADDVV